MWMCGRGRAGSGSPRRPPSRSSTLASQPQRARGGRRCWPRRAQPCSRPTLAHPQGYLATCLHAAPARHTTQPPPTTHAALGAPTRRSATWRAKGGAAPGARPPLVAPATPRTHEVLGDVGVDGARAVRHHIVLRHLGEQRGVVAACAQRRGGTYEEVSGTGWRWATSVNSARWQPPGGGRRVGAQGGARTRPGAADSAGAGVPAGRPRAPPGGCTVARPARARLEGAPEPMSLRPAVEQAPAFKPFSATARSTASCAIRR